MTNKTLHDALQEYLGALKDEGKSERTLYTYSKDAEQIKAYFGPDKKLSSILIPHASGFFKSDALLKLPNGNDRSEPTVKKTIRVFRMFLVWALGKGYIAKLPLPKDISLGHSRTETQDADSSD